MLYRHWHTCHTWVPWKTWTPTRIPHQRVQVALPSTETKADILRRTPSLYNPTILLINIQKRGIKRPITLPRLLKKRRSSIPPRNSKSFPTRCRQISLRVRTDDNPMLLCQQKRSQRPWFICCRYRSFIRYRFSSFKCGRTTRQVCCWNSRWGIGSWTQS